MHFSYFDVMCDGMIKEFNNRATVWYCMMYEFSEIQYLFSHRGENVQCRLLIKM